MGQKIRVGLVLLCCLAGCGQTRPDEPRWRLSSWKNYYFTSYERTPTGVRGVLRDGRLFEIEGTITREYIDKQNVISVRGMVDDNPRNRGQRENRIVISRR